MGQGQGHGMGRDGTVQDMFLIFLCPGHVWDNSTYSDWFNLMLKDIKFNHEHFCDYLMI